MSEKGGDEGESWVGDGPVDEDRPYAWTMSIKEARRRGERERKRTESRFLNAPFPLYGLPRSWEGGRFLGGASWSGTRFRASTHALSLVHGVLVEEEGPMLVVETAWPDAPGGGGVFRILAEELWTGKAPTVADALATLRSRWSGRPFVAGLHPVPGRALALVQVDGRPMGFDTLSRPGHWVARSRIECCQLTLEGQDVPIDGLELVRITDLQPYIQGSRRFEAGRTT